MTKSKEAKHEMFVASMDTVLSRWFTTYEDARALLYAEGGLLAALRISFLLRKVRPSVSLVSTLLTRNPDWERISWDWVRPRGPEAWERLRENPAPGTLE